MKTKFTTNKNVLTVERTFNAPVELVWRAWTEAELLDQWWAPAPWKSETAEMDFKEGGFRLYAMVGPEGEKHWGRTEFDTINRPVDYTGKDVFCDETGKVDPKMPVAVFANNFESKGDQTTVTMITEYADEAGLKAVLEMGMKEGLDLAISQLDEVLAQLVNLQE